MKIRHWCFTAQHTVKHMYWLKGSILSHHFKAYYHIEHEMDESDTSVFCLMAKKKISVSNFLKITLRGKCLQTRIIKTEKHFFPLLLKWVLRHNSVED